MLLRAPLLCVLAPLANLAFLPLAVRPGFAQEPAPLSSLDALRVSVRRSIEAVPNYACATVMERGEMAPETARDYDHAVELAEREGRSRPEPRYDRSDRVRIDVAMIGRRELYSWPDESAFTDVPLPDMIGYGPASTGEYVLHAHNLFISPGAQFVSAGVESVNGRQVECWDFSMPGEHSRYEVRVGQTSLVVPYEGSVWASGPELAAIEIKTSGYPEGHSVHWSRTRTEYQEVALRGESFVLPRVFDVEIQFRSGARNSLKVSLRNCRVYEVESFVTFGEVAAAAAVEEIETPTEVSLSPGTWLRVRIDSRIDLSSAMVGDSIQGALTTSASGRFGSMFPAGSRVEGRIRRLDLLAEPGRHYVLGIELTRIESGGHFAKTRAEMTDATVAPKRPDVASTVDGMRPWRKTAHGEKWKAFFEEWDAGKRTGGPTDYYRGFLPGVGLLFVHGDALALEPGVETRWVTSFEGPLGGIAR